MAIDEIRDRWPTLSFYSPVTLSISDLFRLSAWSPLFETLAVRRDSTRILELLKESEENLDVLREQERITEDIPNQVQFDLGRLQAEAGQLEALLKSEREAGSSGLGEVGSRLEQTRAQVDKALFSLRQAEPSEKVPAVLVVDEVFAASKRAIVEMRQHLSEAGAERIRAYDAITRAHRALALASKRWEALKARGAADPTAGRTLSLLRTKVDIMADLPEDGVHGTHLRVNADIAELAAEFNEYMRTLETLEELINRSQSALETVTEALKDARSLCADLERIGSIAIPDDFSALIERASEAYADAAQQHGRGTVKGYGAAITLSQTATDYLNEATADAESLSERARAAYDLLDGLSSEEAGEWRARASQAQYRLQQYALHWHEDLAKEAQAAISNLDQVAIALESVSINGSSRGRLRQSEIDKMLQILSQARQRMDAAKAQVERLESEEKRIDNLRQQLEDGVARLHSQVLPDIRKMSGYMLPELQQTLDSVQESLQQRAAELDNPALVDYDKAIEEWLPSIERQLDKVRTTHEKSLQRCQGLAAKARRRIDRKWKRLRKLVDKQEEPPPEDMAALADDLEAWHARSEREIDNLPVLHEIGDRQAKELEGRIEEVARQIAAGRRERAGRHRSDGWRKQMARVGELSHVVRARSRGSKRTPKPQEVHRADATQAPVRPELSGTGPPGRKEAGTAAAGGANTTLRKGAMVARSNKTTTNGERELYERGMAHLQAGEWKKAVRCLKELVEHYPDNESHQRALEEAQFKAQLDSKARVKVRRWIIPWNRIALGILIVAATVSVVFVWQRTIRRQIAPALAQAQVERAQAQLLADGDALLEGGELDAAEGKFTELLAQVHTHQEALQGLAEIERKRGLLELYEEAVAFQDAGDHETALIKLTEISILSPRYADVSARITEIRRQQGLEQLLVEAEAAYESGAYPDAVGKYQEIQALNVDFRAEMIAGRLFELYMQLGRELVELDPPMLEMLPKAIDYFTKALSLDPRNAEAVTEQRLARLFMTGRDRYFEGHVDEAIAALRPVYDQRPDYMGGDMLIDMLYDAYIRSGDAHVQADDLEYAYLQYQQAASLPVSDKTLALGRMKQVALSLTPTPTPTNTPTPTATPTVTPIPTALPLAAFHNSIAFLSDNEEWPGVWVMDSSGGNRRYLGGHSSMRNQFNALVEEARYSPDRRYRLFVRDAKQSPQVFVMLPQGERHGDVSWRQLTKLTGVSYDPVWSPDGSRVAFVSQENGTDDIWVINADGSNARNLTRNTWEWEKHPSWSPTSSRIVFWSNRDGHQQIYVMAANGYDLKNISNTAWGEYDPIWVR
jgi:tetratricopeptide (TPR) repeat protein